MPDLLGILLFFSGTVTSPSPLLSVAPPPTSSLPGLRFVSEIGLMPQLWSFKTVALSGACENPWYQCGIHPIGTGMSVLVVKIPPYFHG